MALTFMLQNSFLMLLSLLSCSSIVMSASISIQNYGAIPDGKTDATESFRDAWDVACTGRGSSNEPATIVVPSGQYLLSPIVFSGPCTGNLSVTLLVIGTLHAPNSTHITNDKWIEFKSVKGLSIYDGTFIGREGATSLSIIQSSNVKLYNLTIVNGASSHGIAIHSCDDVEVDGLNIHNSDDTKVNDMNITEDVLNTNCIRIKSSSYVSSYNAISMSADDYISLSFGPKNMTVENIISSSGIGISNESFGEGSTDFNNELFKVRSWSNDKFEFEIAHPTKMHHK